MAKGLGSSSSKKDRMEISTPYDPVHLTHVGFNYHTGEFTVSSLNCVVDLRDFHRNGKDYWRTAVYHKESKSKIRKPSWILLHFTLNKRKRNQTKRPSRSSTSPRNNHHHRQAQQMLRNIRVVSPRQRRSS
jgi:hypothetical protein